MKAIIIRTFATAFALFAAAPFPATAQAIYDGSYHSVDSKSSWSNGKFPKDFDGTITVHFKDGKLIYHSINVHNPSAGLDYTAPLDGTVAPMLNNARFNQVAVKRIGPNQLEILEMKDGDVLVGAYWIFARDHKSFVRRGIAKGDDGKSHEFDETFARQ
jgi:hypothetical protein